MSFDELVVALHKKRTKQTLSGYEQALLKCYRVMETKIKREVEYLLEEAGD